MENEFSNKYKWAIPIDNTTLNGLTETISKMAMKEINENPSDSAPCRLYIGFLSFEETNKIIAGRVGDGAITVVTKLFSPGSNKNENRELMQLEGAAFAVAELGVPVFLAASYEAWISMVEKNKHPKMRPAEDPKRQEIVVVEGAHPDGRTNNAFLHMDRMQNGSIVVTDSSFRTCDSGDEIKSGDPPLESFYEGYANAIQMFSELDSLPPEAKEKLSKQINMDLDRMSKELEEKEKEDLKTIDDLFD